jgi:RNA polymerase sigma-70 factor (ECF subfamily)
VHGLTRRCVVPSSAPGGIRTKLIGAARAGDPAAIDELLRRHEHQIYRFGLRMCGSEQDPREILQETILAAFRNLSGFRGHAQLSTWLYQLARSFCAKRRRPGSGVRAQDSLMEAVDVPSAEPAPDEKAHAREVGEALRAAMQSPRRTAKRWS